MGLNGWDMNDSGPDLWDKFGISKAFALTQITNG